MQVFKYATCSVAESFDPPLKILKMPSTPPKKCENMPRWTVCPVNTMPRVTLENKMIV